jgi:hypothetical protein
MRKTSSFCVVLFFVGLIGCNKSPSDIKKAYEQEIQKGIVAQLSVPPNLNLAILHYTIAISIDPKRCRAYMFRALCYTDQQRIFEAFTDARKAETLPGYPDD